MKRILFTFLFLFGISLTDSVNADENTKPERISIPIKKGVVSEDKERTLIFVPEVYQVGDKLEILCVDNLMLYILDINGNIVHSESVAPGISIIDVSYLIAGEYVIQLDSTNSYYGYITI